MWNLRKIFCTVAVAVCLGCLLSGCTDDDTAPDGARREVAVMLSAGSRTVSETDGSLTDDEKAIHTLRVYAFVNGKKAGHYFTNNVTEDPHTFFMDIAFYTDGEQTVDFYAVGNETAMTTTSGGLSENITESELKNFWFSNMLADNLNTKGLPMYCDKTPVKLDFTKLKTESPIASGHEGHAWLDYSNIEFELKRPMAKLGVFVAKPEGENAELKITGLTMLQQGTRNRNYLMTPTEQMLKEIKNYTSDISMKVVEESVDKTLAENITETERKNPANYTPVMAEPFYPFESPWSNGGSWNIPGTDNKEHVLKIDYTFGDTPHTGYVYMPAVLRNHYYAICCLMRNDGVISVEYLVADWDDENYEIDYNYPDYSTLVPANQAEAVTYSQPEVYYNADATSEAGTYTFKFSIKGPTGQKWTPTLMLELGTTDNFEVKTYQSQADGSKRYLTSHDEYVASQEPYYITVRALKSENAGKQVGLAIAYDRVWGSEGSNMLLINGSMGNLIFEGSAIPEIVVIKQTDVPTVQP